MTPNYQKREAAKKNIKKLCYALLKRIIVFAVANLGNFLFFSNLEIERRIKLVTSNNHTTKEWY